mmetsp:Transcript_16671/g.34004  ORF Transcript_16671/g.34004 Transcript_16671/m.34004 type:complete len:99 (-) Transcript_16671:244-540(-)
MIALRMHSYIRLLARSFTSAPSPEIVMQNLLTDNLNASFVQVDDVSGGCGSMYKVEVESPQFVGINMVKQHKLVTGVLSEHIAAMHGITIKTRRPPTE